MEENFARPCPENEALRALAADILADLGTRFIGKQPASDEALRALRAPYTLDDINL